eukprot:m.12636 g.12636  ORF g.12636 m.12636 type:complete len:181 (+) comp4697_c0_seq1:197-739(+)
MNAFKASLKKYPLMTNVGTAWVIMSVGDGVAQQLEKKPTIDMKRNLVASSWNSLIVAPAFFYWFGFLDRRYPKVVLNQILKKVIINQAVVTLPLNAGFLLFTYTFEKLWNRQTPNKNEIMAKLNLDLNSLIGSSLMFWLPVNTMNFVFVPPQYRVLPTIFASLVWATYLSLVGHRPTKET